MPLDPLTLPVDAAAQQALAPSGLRYGLIDPADDAQVRAWMEAEARGFHEPGVGDESFEEIRDDHRSARTSGVWDASLADPEVPAATITAWPAAMTVPGGEVTGWAISGVTVASTHRRRGIARAMVEAELRTAAAAGLPVSILTVSEATIYSRYGFGPAAFSADLEVDVRRAGWVGAPAPGRVQLVERATAIETARTLLPEARRGTTGDVQIVGHRFERLFGLPSDPLELRKRRFARYDDADGVPRGLAVYRLDQVGTDFTRHTADVRILATTTDDAYRALWHHLLELDLVESVRAPLRSVSEPLRWLVRDPRRIRTTELREHLWVRVIDPVAALGARTYGAPGRLGLVVADPLGYADGEWLLEVDASGAGRVTAGAAPDGVPTLTLPVDLLGSLYLGGVPAETLARAGRLAERAAGDAAQADRVLRSPRPPVLTTWF